MLNKKLLVFALMLSRIYECNDPETSFKKLSQLQRKGIKSSTQPKWEIQK